MSDVQLEDLVTALTSISMAVNFSLGFISGVLIASILGNGNG